MSAGNYKHVLDNWAQQVWSNGDFTMADQLMAADYTIYDCTQPEPMTGVDNFKGFVTAFRTAFPDLNMKVVDVVNEGDKVAWRWTATGTQTGQLMHIPPTGKGMAISGICVSRFENGKWKEDHSTWDFLGMLQQLGVAG